MLRKQYRMVSLKTQKEVDNFTETIYDTHIITNQEELNNAFRERIRNPQHPDYVNHIFHFYVGINKQPINISQNTQRDTDRKRISCDLYLICRIPLMDNNSIKSLLVDFKWWYPLATVLTIVIAAIWFVAEPIVLHIKGKTDAK